MVTCVGDRGHYHWNDDEMLNCRKRGSVIIIRYNYLIERVKVCCVFIVIDVRCSSKTFIIIMRFPLMRLLLCSFGNDCDAGHDLDQEHSLPPMSYSVFAVVLSLASSYASQVVAGEKGRDSGNYQCSRHQGCINRHTTHLLTLLLAQKIDQISTSFYSHCHEGNRFDNEPKLAS